MKVYNVLALPRSGHTHIIFNLFSSELNNAKHVQNDSYYYSLQLTDKIGYLTPWDHNTYIEPHVRPQLNRLDYLLIDNQNTGMINIPYRYPNDFPYKIDHTIIILRDYFNNLASVVKQRQRYIDRLVEYGPKFNEAWKKLAKEIIWGKLDKTVVLYNNWVKSEPYRRGIYSKLGLSYNFTNVIPHNGSGSSFEDTNYFDRFSQIQGCIYRELLDTECIKLNRKLFDVYGPSYVKYPWWVRLKRWYTGE